MDGPWNSSASFPHVNVSSSARARPLTGALCAAVHGAAGSHGARPSWGAALLLSFVHLFLGGEASCRPQACLAPSCLQPSGSTPWAPGSSPLQLPSGAAALCPPVGPGPCTLGVAHQSSCLGGLAAAISLEERSWEVCPPICSHAAQRLRVAGAPGQVRADELRHWT